jgi:hypothetical protein
MNHWRIPVQIGPSHFNQIARNAMALGGCHPTIFFKFCAALHESRISDVGELIEMLAVNVVRHIIPTF